MRWFWIVVLFLLVGCSHYPLKHETLLVPAGSPTTTGGGVYDLQMGVDGTWSPNF